MAVGKDKLGLEWHVETVRDSYIQNTRFSDYFVLGAETICVLHRHNFWGQCPGKKYYS
jgi:hypothetical protein